MELPENIVAVVGVDNAGNIVNIDASLFSTVTSEQIKQAASTDSPYTIAERTAPQLSPSDASTVGLKFNLTPSFFPIANDTGDNLEDSVMFQFMGKVGVNARAPSHKFEVRGGSINIDQLIKTDGYKLSGVNFGYYEKDLSTIFMGNATTADMISMNALTLSGLKLVTPIYKLRGIGVDDNGVVSTTMVRSDGAEFSVVNSLNVTLATLTSTAGLNLSTINHATTDTDKFLVSDSGVVKYRTGAEALLDLDAVPYTGAYKAVDLGEWGITAGNFIFDTTPTGIPTAQGSMYWDSAEETVALIMNGTTQRVGQDLFFPVKNQTGSTIPKGTGVRFAGTLGASGRLLIAPFIANGTYPSKYFMGITSEDITNGSNGQVIAFGKIRKVNTSSFSNGDILYASTTVAGGFQTTAPTAPNNIVVVAAVVYADATNGELIVRASPGSNISEDEGIKLLSLANKDVLQYNTSNSLWENKTLYAAGIAGLGTTAANTLAYFDTIGTLSSLSTSTYPSLTEISYVKGVTSAIQAQIDGKQPQINGLGFVKASGTTITYDNSTYLTTISGITAGGELSGTYPNPTLVNAAVTNKVLTGLNVIGGSIAATDTILEGFGKLQNQLNALSGAVIYQGVWNASTNSPTLTSSVGTKGYYYIVNVAGSTSLNGTSDWKVGDWVIFDGTTWNKVDNTDSVTSVNGYIGAVSLTTSDIPEALTPVNLYFTNARARSALSFAAGSGAYNSTTGVITIPTNNSQIANGAGYITGITSLMVTTALGYTPVTDARTLTINGTTYDLTANRSWTISTGSALTGSGTAGQVTFWAGTSAISGDSSFTWDGTNKRLTLGYSSGDYVLDTGSDIRARNVLIGSGIGSNIGNTRVGKDSLINLTTGQGITAMGYEAGQGNTTGYDNTFVGYQAGKGTLGGFRNSFFGNGAGFGNVGGNYNSFFGNSAGRINGTGEYNTFIGHTSGYENSGGSNNTFVGYDSGLHNSTGSANVALGKSAGQTNMTGASNIFIGHGADSSTTNLDNQIVIGYGTVGVGANSTVIGNISTVKTAIYGRLLLTSPFSDDGTSQLQVNGVAKASSFVKSGGSSSQYLMADGSVSTLTNPITGTGTINELAYFTGAGTLASLAVATYPSLAEISYVKGVTSAIQTQLNAKQATLSLTSGYLPYATGTNTLANSIIYQSSGRVRINTTSDDGSSLLQVNGKILSYDTITSTGIIQNAVSNSPYTNSAILRSAASTGMFMSNNAVSNWIGIKTDGTLDFNGASNFVGNATFANQVKSSTLLVGTSATQVGRATFGTASDEYIDIVNTTEVSGKATGIRFGNYSAGDGYKNAGIFYKSVGDGLSRGNLIVGMNLAGSGVNATPSDAVLTFNGINGNAIFSGTITAFSLIKSGGTSSQYLMADGSVSTLTNPVTGTGTTNYIPKWTSSSAVGNSAIYDAGSSVLGIGTTSPLIATSRQGMVIRGGSTGAEIVLQSTNSTNGTYDGFSMAIDADIAYLYNKRNGNLQFGTNNALKATLKTNGDFDITGAYLVNGTAILSGSGSSGQIGYWSGSTTFAGSANLFWNNTDKKMGIGTVSATLFTGRQGLVIRGSSAGAELVLQSTNSTDGTYDGLSLAMDGDTAYIFNKRNGDLQLGANNARRATLTVGGDFDITGVYKVNGVALSSGVGGTGSANYLASFASSTTIASSGMYTYTGARTYFVLGGTTAGTSPLTLDNYGEITHNQTANYTPSTYKYNGTSVGTITVNSTSTAYNTSSDYRLKTDYKPFSGIDLVNKMNMYDHAWKIDGSRSYSAIAHELQEIIPYAVTGIKDGKEFQSVDYSKIVPVLVQAIKDQQKEIDILKLNLK